VEAPLIAGTSPRPIFTRRFSAPQLGHPSGLHLCGRLSWVRRTYNRCPVPDIEPVKSPAEPMVRGLSAGGEWIRTTGSSAADPHLPFVRFTKFRSSIKLCRGMASRGFPPPEVASHERKFAPGIVSFVTRLFQRCRHPQDGARADHLLCSPVPRSGRFGIAPKVTADLVHVVAPGAQDFSGIAALRRGAGGNVRLSER